MYIHIGSNKSVRKSDIVAIFDLDTSTVSVHTRNYLARAQREALYFITCRSSKVM